MPAPDDEGARGGAEASADLARDRVRAAGAFAGFDFEDRVFRAVAGFFDKKWSEK
ncbi:MAG: hypothetical protein ABI724_17150 [Betaproteobacteria bacterium]